MSPQPSYFARERDHPAFKASMLTSIVQLDGKVIANWLVVNEREGYVVVREGREGRQMLRGVVYVTKGVTTNARLV